jgi:hypothetical protein
MMDPIILSPLKQITMKQLRSTCLGVCLLLLCINAAAQGTPANTTSTKATNTQNTDTVTSMKGAYAMISQKFSVDNQDSIYTIQQLKIYTDKYFMYAHARSGDSLADYGIGTYRLENGSVLEYPFYTSTGGANRDTIALQITKRADGYSQVINFPPDSAGRRFVLTEDYRTVSRPVSTSLDGAWKMTKAIQYPKMGAPMETTDAVQFKVFQSGYYMWARTMKDSATQKPVSFFGYGTFEMTSPGQVRELTSQSSFRSQLVGKPVTLQVAFKGKDAYEQTIVWPDGVRIVESYERLQ